MKIILKKMALILALILIVDSCNTVGVFEVKGDDTSNLSITNVNLDVSNAEDISEDRILTSKELSISVNTESSSDDAQTFILYKKTGNNNENKEIVKSENISTKYIENENRYVASVTFEIDTQDNTYLVGEYCIGVKSDSHTTEVFEDVKTSINGKDVKKIEIDRVSPQSSNCSVKVHTWMQDGDEKASMRISGTFVDINSGIKKIEYSVNNGDKQEYALNGENDHNPGEEIEFLLNREGRDDVVKINVVDNAGNEYECSSDKFDIEKPDNLPPIIENVVFETYIDTSSGTTTEPIITTAPKKFEENSHILFNKICIINAPFIIKVKVKDVAPEGVTVAGMDPNAADAVELYDGERLIGQFKLADDCYSYTVSGEFSADSLCVKAKDINGYTIKKKISEIDNTKKDSYYMEKAKPSIKADYKNSVSSGGKHWYNNDGGDFILSIEDKDSGINSIIINDTFEGKTTTYSEENFNEQKKEFTSTIDTSKLSHGEHTITAIIEDNCGNISTEDYNINIDHYLPSISYYVENPQNIVIDGKDWYDINDELIVKATLNKDIASITEAKFEINGKSYSYSESISDLNDTLEVELKIPVKDYLEINQNSIDIKGYVKAESGNNNNSKDIYNCNIDKKNPEINSVIINKIDESSFVPTFNLIYTGIYSNNSVKFRIEASDAQGDSGIDYVEFAYYKNGNRIVNKLKSTENKFEYILPFEINSEVFNSKFEIIAYDKCGKESKFSPSIRDEKGNSTDKYFIMQENIAPTVNINLPKGDGSERTDNQVWYNKNKNISINLHDAQSGIRYAKISVNGVEIVKDTNGNKIIDSVTSKLFHENKNSLTYNFTTDYIIEKVGEAKDGNYKIKVELSDNAGNIYVDNKKSFNIDRTNPSVDKITFSRKSADNVLTTEDFVTKLKYGYYFNDTFYLKIDTSDKKPSSGLSRIEYKLVTYNNGKREKTSLKTATIVNGVSRIEVPKEFKGQIFIKAIDMVGNESKQVTTLGYIEDENAPEITISPLKQTKNKDNAGNNLYSKNVSVNVSIKDSKSGLRKIEYYIDAENNKVEKKVITLQNEGYKEGDKLDNGWIITKMDNNLVVEVSQKFMFSSDDNDIRGYFKASDRAGNETKYNKTQKFSIDKTAPVVRVDFSSGVKSNPKYYNDTKKAIMNITVDERNFNQKLLEVVVTDSYHNNKISPKFIKQKGKYTYVATIDYPEGDYSVNVSGKDIAGHKARIYSDGEKKSKELYTTEFIVDTTKPSVSTNFATFNNGNNKKGNYFNKKKTATITVREHNFDPELMNLSVWEKTPGQGQSLSGTEKNSYVAYSAKGWNSKKDVHSIELQFERDGIYKIEMKPSDISENKGNTESTVIFEIDTTAPEIMLINGEDVDKKKTNVIDVYDEKRKDDDSPTVEYYDANFDHIKYEVVKYIPEYQNEKEFSKVLPERIKETVNKSEFKLENFEKDGIYAVKLVAYDKAGNASEVNKNTYVRMVQSDVLAYIEDSHPGENGQLGKGWYSIEDESGPLSKRPDNFEDLNIAVLTKKNSDISITLNSNDGDITDTGVKCSAKDEVYGAGVYRYVLSKDYFKDHYQEDTDATFYLTVNDSNKKIELGQIHIDNIAPECKLPSYFHNWGWMKGNGKKNIEITNISERIDTSTSFVYIDGEKVKYSYNADKNMITFAIKDGSHSVGVSLVDYAGNEYNIPEISHLGVGNFRLYLGIGMSVLFIVGICALIIFRRKRKVRNLE